MIDKKKDDDDRRYLGLVGIPFVIIVAPFCGYLIGNWLDGLFDTKPYLSYVFLALGIGACIREVYKMYTTFGKND